MQRLDGIPSSGGADVGVPVRVGIPVDLDAVARKVAQPHFGNAGPGIQRDLDVAVVLDRAVGHLDDQEGVGEGGGGFAEELRPPPDDRQVGLRLGTPVERDRICTVTMPSAPTSRTRVSVR
jgi:hypothetical protein